MSWAEKIDNKKYVPGSAINFVIALYAGWPSKMPMMALAYVVVGSILNQYFTVKAFIKMFETTLSGDDAPKNKKILFYVVGKTLFLVSAFMALVIYSRNHVLQGLTLYTFQLIILCLSIKNIGQFFKKGTPP